MFYLFRDECTGEVYRVLCHGRRRHQILCDQFVVFVSYFVPLTVMFMMYLKIAKELLLRDTTLSTDTLRQVYNSLKPKLKTETPEDGRDLSVETNGAAIETADEVEHRTDSQVATSKGKKPQPNKTQKKKTIEVLSR